MDEEKKSFQFNPFNQDLVFTQGLETELPYEHQITLLYKLINAIQNNDCYPFFLELCKSYKYCPTSPIDEITSTCSNSISDYHIMLDIDEENKNFYVKELSRQFYEEWKASFCITQYIELMEKISKSLKSVFFETNDLPENYADVYIITLKAIKLFIESKLAIFCETLKTFFLEVLYDKIHLVIYRLLETRERLKLVVPYSSVDDIIFVHCMYKWGIPEEKAAAIDAFKKRSLPESQLEDELALLDLSLSDPIPKEPSVSRAHEKLAPIKLFNMIWLSFSKASERPGRRVNFKMIGNTLWITEISRPERTIAVTEFTIGQKEKNSLRALFA